VLTRPCGVRQTEVTVDALYSVAAWLRKEGHLPSTALLPWKEWREDLSNEWEQITGSKANDDDQPRHSGEEVAAFFDALDHPETDPRFAALFALGGEQRLGQVLRCWRSHLRLVPDWTPDHGELRGLLDPPAAGKKKTSLIGLTLPFFEVITRAFNGYLAHLEAAFQKGEISDYPLFPAGRLKKGKAKVGPKLKSMTRTTALEMFHDVERFAGIEPVKGRGWYGVRRTATDLAEDVEQDERVLNSLTGHRDSETRRNFYQQRNRPEILISASNARVKLRQAGAKAESVQANGPRNGPQSESALNVNSAALAELVPLHLLRAERATGLEPATSSLGSWHSTN
jgi:integrase